MNKEALIPLTEKLYKATLLFPKKEPLRYKMREYAVVVLENFIGLSFSKNFQQIKTDLLLSLEVLDGFFEVAKKQNWLREEDILAIQQEYDSLKADIQSESSEESIISQRFKITESLDSGETNYLTGFFPGAAAIIAGPENQGIDEKVNPLINSGLVNPRQKTILDFLKENGRAQVWQIKEILPDISKRTLRRDFEYMLKQGIIERIGERNDTFYQMKIVEF